MVATPFLGFIGGQAVGGGVVGGGGGGGGGGGVQVGTPIGRVGRVGRRRVARHFVHSLHTLLLLLYSQGSSHAPDESDGWVGRHS